jgi:hypothetical protein
VQCAETTIRREAETASLLKHEILADVRVGVMNGPKATSALSPFDSQLRTLVGAARRPHSCQFLTHAPQQNDVHGLVYSITSSARASTASGTVRPSAFAVRVPRADQGIAAADTHPSL